MLHAWIGVKVPPNDYYPVIVGGYNYLSGDQACLTPDGIIDPAAPFLAMSFPVAPVRPQLSPGAGRLGRAEPWR